MHDDESEIKEAEIPEGFHEEVPEADVPHDEVVDPLIDEDDMREGKEDADRGFFLEDREFEKQMLDPDGDNPEFS